MSTIPAIFCDAAELAVECARAGSGVGLETSPRSELDVSRATADALSRGEPAAMVMSRPPRPEELVLVACAAARTGQRVAICVLDPGELDAPGLARDLGLVAVNEIGPLIAAVALLVAGAKRPWTASIRGLSAADRVRLSQAVIGAERGGGKLVQEDEGRIALAIDRGPTVLLGTPRDAAAAIAALRTTSLGERPSMPAVEGARPEAVLDVIFGPPRALSDPASKAALEPYDIPLPVEELCTSASRAAAEAARIGFPVRIALASPDLRIWDHPDLVADGVDNAARVRDVFRQMLALARTRNKDARLLGVTVSATTAVHALLRVRATSLPEGLVLVDLGFADPHGFAANDRIHTVLPATEDDLRVALERLAGAELLLGSRGSTDAGTVAHLHDVLLRVSAFVHDWRNKIESVEIDPLCVLVGGGIEVREACVTVGDAFVRSLEGGNASPELER